MMGPHHENGPEAVPDKDRFIDGADKEVKFLVRCSYLEIY
jgi:hypothetical protein